MPTKNSPFSQLLGGFLNPLMLPNPLKAATFLTGLAPSRAGTGAMGTSFGGRGGMVGSTRPITLPSGPLQTYGDFSAQSSSPLAASPDQEKKADLRAELRADLRTDLRTTPSENVGGLPGLNSPSTPVTTYTLPGSYGTTETYTLFTDPEGYATFMDADAYNTWSESGREGKTPFNFRATFTDENGKTYEARTVIDSAEISAMAALQGVSPEELINDMTRYGYYLRNNNLYWSGGMGTSGTPQGESPWWKGFESEKEANRYYNEKRRAEKREADRNNPHKSGEHNKPKGGYSITAASSVMGTG